MRDIGQRYLDYHFDNTFTEEIETRQLLKIDWYDDEGIRAALYMSKVNPSMDDVDDFLQDKSLVDLILLCPPLNQEDITE